MPFRQKGPCRGSLGGLVEGVRYQRLVPVSQLARAAKNKDASGSNTGAEFGPGFNGGSLQRQPPSEIRTDMRTKASIYSDGNPQINKLFEQTGHPAKVMCVALDYAKAQHTARRTADLGLRGRGAQNQAKWA